MKPPSENLSLIRSAMRMVSFLNVNDYPFDNNDTENIIFMIEFSINKLNQEKDNNNAKGVNL